MRNNKGITLVSLVVTIIILVILATISITFALGNNGIFKQAEEASTINRGATVQERVDFYKMDYQAKKYVDTWGTQTEEELLNKLLQEKLVKEEEIDRTAKKITIGDKVIDYDLADKTALIMTVNSGEDGILLINFGNVNFDNIKIEWGDGTVNQEDMIISSKESIIQSTKIASKENKWKVASVDGNWVRHQYPEKNKEYQIKVTGVCKRIDTKNIKSINQWGETGLETINIGGPYLEELASPTKKSFENMANFSSSFKESNLLKEIPTDLFSYAPNAKKFDNAFENCTSLEVIPEGLFDNCMKAEFFNYTFQGCTSLKYLPERLFENCTEIKQILFAFSGCKGLLKVPELWKYMIEVTDSEKYVGRPLGVGCFYECTGASNYDQIPELWRNSFN